MKTQRWIPALAVLLAVQLLLGLWLWSPGEQAARARTGLLAFDRQAVDAVEISDGEGRTQHLEKTADGWRLPGHFDFPASAFRVDGLLDSLADLRPGLAVATSAEAAGRFRVAEESFERRIRLLAGGKTLAELYLGDAAGPRRAYGRAAGDTAIYPLALTAFDAGTGAGEWTDKAYLHRDTAELSRVTVGDITLQRDSDAWVLTDLAEGEQTDADAAAELVRGLTQLNFMAVIGPKDNPPGGTSLLDAQLVYADGRQVDYHFLDPGQEGDPLLLVSDRDHVLRIGSYAVKPLLEASRKTLLQGS
jgi:hypothetical protein